MPSDPDKVAQIDSILRHPPAGSLHVELRPAFDRGALTCRPITRAQAAGFYLVHPASDWGVVLLYCLGGVAALALVLGMMGIVRW